MYCCYFCRFPLLEDGTCLLKLKLNRDVNGGTTISPSSLINLGAMSSGPVALFVFKFNFLFLTVLSCILMTSEVGVPASVCNISNCAASVVPIYFVGIYIPTIFHCRSC